MASVIDVKSVSYPESDGKPIGETDLHRDAMVRHIGLLKGYFRDEPVYVSGDLLSYYGGIPRPAAARVFAQGERIGADRTG